MGHKIKLSPKSSSIITQWLRTMKKNTLTAAFKELRKKGFIARQNYLCCQSCAGCQIAMDIGKMKTEGKEVKGCVYYHRQDAEDRKNGIRKYDKNGKYVGMCHDFHLAYGNVDNSEHGTIGLPTVEVGKIVCETLAKFGIETKWNGSENERILVIENTIRNLE